MALHGHNGRTRLIARRHFGHDAQERFGAGKTNEDPAPVLEHDFHAIEMAAGNHRPRQCRQCTVRTDQLQQTGFERGIEVAIPLLGVEAAELAIDFRQLRRQTLPGPAR